MKRIISLMIPVMTMISANAQVSLIAHRGASYIAPENTIAAAKLAWKYKADAVECDIWMTRDSMILCSHDGNTKRTTGQDLKISETSSATLRMLDAGSFKDKKYKGQKLPFLYELIKTVPAGKELVIEIKCGPEVIPLLKATLGKYGKGKTFTFICFDLKTIIETKKSFPVNSCYWLSSNTDDLKANFAKVAEAGLNGVSLNYSIINEEVMKRAADLKLDVFSWTVDDPDEARRLITLRVKGITTNRPGWLAEQVEELQR